MAKKTFRDYTALGSISAKIVLKNLPFVLFLAFLALVYIANAHYSEKTVREIKKAQSEVEELRWKYMALKAELMYKGLKSEVSKRVKEDGLRPAGTNVKKIVVDEY